MLKVDLHIHTVASGHAFNTILEYINRASELNMTMIGISDHGPTLLGSATNEIYFRVLKRIPRVVNGITVLRGIEANIMNEQGDIDLSDKVCGELDYVMAAFHFDTPGYKDQGREANTETIIRTIKSGKVNILTHPFLTRSFDIDIRRVAEAACEHGVLLELNISCFEFAKQDDKMLNDLKIMLEVVKSNGKKVIINSDAHTIWQLADETPLEKLKGMVDLPKELIINNYPEELLEFLDIKDEK